MQINTKYISNDPTSREEKHNCPICSKDLLKHSYKWHLQSCKHKNNSEDTAGFVIENTDGAFKDHLKNIFLEFKESEPKSVAEAIVKVSLAVETLINTSLREFNTIKCYMGVKLFLTKEYNERNELKEETPNMRINPYFIS